MESVGGQNGEGEGEDGGKAGREKGRVEGKVEPVEKAGERVVGDKDE